jgi:hypothetical protein
MYHFEKITCNCLVLIHIFDVQTVHQKKRKYDAFIVAKRNRVTEIK